MTRREEEREVINTMMVAEGYKLREENNQLKGERDALKVRVMDLRECLNLLLNDCINFDGGELTEIYQISATRCLNRTPQQSLEAHDREVAARALDKISDDAEKARAATISALVDFGEGHRVAILPELSVSVVELRNRAAKLRAGGEKG